MKRLFLQASLLILFIQLLVHNSVICQTIYIQAGPSISAMDWELKGTSVKFFDKSVIGYNGKVGVDFLDHKYLDVFTSFSFIQKGGKDSIFVPEDSMIVNGTYQLKKARLNFISLSAGGEVKFPVKEHFIPFVMMGPRVDHLLSWNNDASFMDAFDKNDQLNKWIFGWDFGIGCKFIFDKVQLGLVYTYYSNFTAIAEDNRYSGMEQKISDNTQTINFLLGYRF